MLAPGPGYGVLRRIFSTMMVDNEASPKDIQRQRRHSRADMSMYYAKAIPRSVAQEVENLTERLFGGNCPKVPQTVPKTSRPK
jgi:hypothetical protein